jgi:2-polyprenyl-3-methyl-5-hydroxy-6-metoxy-1,4-benzoquinol methylase
MEDTLREKEMIPCPVCSAKSAEAFVKDGYDYRRCLACDFVFVHPVPDPESVYDKEYFAGAGHGFGYVDYDTDKAAMRHAFEQYLVIVESLSGKKGTLLDIGAATGYFMDIARGRGWTVEGVEISDYAAEKGREKGLLLHTGTLGNAPLTAREYDAVSMLDLIEHVRDPVAEIQKAAKLLARGGRLIINTPDTGSMLARMLGRNWHQYVPPEHIMMFNAKNLKALLEKNGLRVEKVTRIGKKFTLQYVFETLERHIRVPGVSGLLAFLKKSPLGKLSIPLNLFDNIFVVAQKV